MKVLKNYWIHVVAFLAILIGIIFNKNTFDSGDSILHYLISKYSFAHPELFLNQWGKPVFTTLASPFTYWGWNGMKVFNGLVGFITCIYLYKICEAKKQTTAFLPVLMLLLVPSYFLCLQSGLTEPLFGFILIVGMYFVTTKQHHLSAIIISFLPFVRSEGNIIIIVYALYFLLNKKYTSVLLLSMGTVFYSMIGTFHYHDITWVFTSNPYTGKFSADNYGSGPWNHYFVQFYYSAGLPYIIFFVIGLIPLPKLIYQNWQQFKSGKGTSEDLWLVYGVFASYFFAHVVFWTFGLYHSFGMARVIIAIIPIGALIAFNGILFFQEQLPPKAKSFYIGFVLLLILIIPFSGNKVGFHFEKDFVQLSDQTYIDEIIKKDVINKVSYKKVSFTHPYIAECLNVDMFDKQTFTNVRKTIKLGVKEKTLVIWDSWFCVFEQNIKAKDIRKTSSIVEEVPLSVEPRGDHAVKVFLLSPK